MLSSSICCCRTKQKLFVKTYRIFVLNSTAIDCAIVLSLLTNSMPASRATAITHLSLSLSFSHSLLVRGLVSRSLRSRHCVSDEMRACNATQRSAARRSANCICSRRTAGRSLYRRRESCCYPVSERVAPPRDQEEPQKSPVLSTCRPTTIIHPVPADLLTSGSTHS